MTERGVRGERKRVYRDEGCSSRGLTWEEGMKERREGRERERE